MALYGSLLLPRSLSRHPPVHLSFEEEGLADADKDILTAADGKLRRISIQDCDMDSDQVEAILSCGNLS